MYNDMQKIEPKEWIGWSLTIIISILAAWMSMSGRVYGTESQLNVLEKRIEIMERSYDRQVEINEKLDEQYNKIITTLTEIKGAMNLKADKKLID
jgi:predicted ArsR family transcriptional regulator